MTTPGHPLRAHVLVLVHLLALGCSTRPRTPDPTPPPLRPPPHTPDPTPPTPVPVDPPPTDRLPDHIRPLEYHLELAIDPALATYSGRIAIDVDITRPISSLWLHARELDITAATLRKEASLPLTRLDAPADSGLLGLAAAQTITSGRATLTIEFTGRYGPRIGLFRQRSAGRWYVFTDMEPRDARRAFPCFDEPRWKTPWNVALVIPEGQRGFANAPEVADRADRAADKTPQRQHLLFSRTRPLPTYLVAVAVGPFDVVAGATEPVPFRAITLAGRGAEAAQALAMAPPLLRLLEDYMGRPQPFPKLDFVTIPEFYGAMENPGLITVSAGILLHDPSRPSRVQRRTQAMVIAHELAHLWFGDLVTPADWIDLWLNEGMATWMTDLIVDRWDPSLQWSLEGVTARRSAMNIDLQPDAPAVRRNAGGRVATDRNAGVIVYLKGGAILGALEAYLGADPFRRALQAYVAAHADGNARAEDLYRALSSASTVDATAPLRSLAETPGVALVDAELQCAAAPQLSLDVRRLPAGYTLPVCIRWGGASPGRTCHAITTERAAIVLPATAGCPPWVHPNAGETGYYRWRLPPGQLDALLAAPLDAREHTGLVDQLTGLVHAGELAPADLLPRVPTLAQRASRQSTDYLLELLHELRLSATRPRAAAAIADLARTSFASRARQLGLAPRPADTDDDAMSRDDLLRAAGILGGDRALGRAARRLVDAWLAGKATIDEELLDTIVILAATTGDRRLHTRLLADLRSAATQADFDRRWAVLGGLASFRRPALLTTSLRLTLVELRGADAVRLLAAALDDATTRPAAVAFLGAHAAELGFRLGPLVPTIASRACTATEERAITPLLDAWTAADPTRTPAAAELRSDLAACAARRQRLATGLDAYLRAR